MTALGGRANFYVIAAAALLRLFVGIHNGWDTVTHLVSAEGRRRQ